LTGNKNKQDLVCGNILCAEPLLSP